MRIPIQKSNFTAGEIKPQLHAREDLAVYQNGAKIIENRLPMPEGGLERRPGTRLVMALPDQANPGKLIPFKFSRTDARLLVLSAGVATVCYSGGGIILSGGRPYTFAIPSYWDHTVYPKIRWVESADVIFVVDGVDAPKQLKRVSDTDWTMGVYQPINGPTLNQNIDPNKTIVASGLTGMINLTANFPIFDPGHFGSVWRLDEGDLGTIPYWTADQPITVSNSKLDPSTYRRHGGAVYAGWTGGAPGTPTTGFNPPSQLFGSAWDGAGTAAWQFLYQDFAYVQVFDVFSPYSCQAFVLGVGNTQQNVLPDSLVTMPTYRWAEAAWSFLRGWPNLVAYCQQRLGFLRDYEFWLTYSGDNFNFLIDTTDASSISGDLLSIDGSVLQPVWTYSSGWIVVGCADSEPTIRGPNMFDPLTPSDLLAVVDKGQGSAPHIPAIVDAAVANIGVSRQRLYYTKINRLIDTINVEEISINSQHVLGGLAAGVAYQHDPYRMIWGFSQNGDLWSYTFLPAQSVIAAARHPMPNAFVEDIAAIPSADGTGIEVWMIVRRVFGGQTFRFVEMMTQPFGSAEPLATDASAAWYVDCGIPYSGPPAATLSGLPFPDGTIVRVFGDGSWVGDFASANGMVRLPRPVSSAVAGLPIKARVRTLPLDPTRPGSTTRGDMKRATHAAVDLYNAFGGAAQSWALDNEFNWQSSGYGEDLFPSGSLAAPPAAVPLFTGRKSIPLDGPAGRRIEIEIVDDHPYPSTILALAPDIEDAEI